MWLAFLPFLAHPLPATPLPAAPPGQLESGIPPFSVFGRESLGLDALPSDLHLMPDGRLLVVSPRQIALGDGARWEVFNRSASDTEVPLEGVGIAPDGTIYAPLRTGFGKVEFKEDGTWWLHQVADLPKALVGEISTLRFCIDVDGTWFWHSESGLIIRWNPGDTPRPFGRASTIETIFSYRDHFYISDRVLGRLSRVDEEGNPTPISSDLAPTVDNAVTCTLPFGDQLLVGTYARGLHLFDGEKLTPFRPAGALFPGSRIVDLRPSGPDHFIAAIDGVGLIYLDRQGNLIDLFERTRDPRISRIRKIVPTNEGFFWALLAEGIARIELPSPFTTFESLLPTGTDYVNLARHDGGIWIIADGRILAAQYDRNHRLQTFVERPLPHGFAASLHTLSGNVLVGVEDTVFRWDQDHWVDTGFDISDFRPAAGGPVDGHWLYTARQEIGWFSFNAEGELVVERIPSPQFSSAYDSRIDADGIIWLEMGAATLGRLRIGPNRSLDLQILGAEQGVPQGWIQVYSIDEKPGFNISDRLFRFNEETGRLEPHLEHERQFSGFRYVIGRPVRDAAGRVWVAGDDRIHVYDTSTDPWTDLRYDLPRGLRPYYITPEADGVIWLHGDERLVRFDPRISQQRNPANEAIITRIILTGSRRTVFKVGDRLADLDYDDNSFTAYFAAPNTGLHPPTTFEVRLSRDEDWDSHGTSGSATFNRLPEGDYELQVRARSGDYVSEPDTVAFRIKPPWFRNNLVYLAYGAAALGFIGLAVWSSTLLERRENQRLEKLVKLRTAELKETNEQLEEQVEEIRILSQAINQSPVSVLITQDDGSILFANPRACELTGFRESQLIGRHVADLREAETESAQMAELLTTLREGNTWTGELINRHADGHLVHVRSSISPIRNADGSVRFHLILEEDITALLAERERHRRLEDQLFQARKLESIGTLAGGIAHDFNNILTGILGHTEIALLDLDPQSQLAADLQDIRKSGLRAKDLVSQILTFSRKADSKLAPIDLSRPIYEAIKLVRATTPAYIEIAQNLTPGFVMADATQVHQIVLNLCTNAVHAIDEKSGRIAVELRPLKVSPELCAEVPDLRPGDHMVLEVSDNGIGMDASTLERIFDPFFTTKEQGKGTGLGLSTVQGIMASHQGAHRVRSQLGVGTTFELYFPICRQSTPVPKAERESVLPGEAREVLIVDDEKTVVQFVATRLKQFGYTACIFEDPRLALKAFRAEPQRFAALVTDLTMPFITGTDLIQKIRDSGSSIPAIVITGYGRENALERLHTLSNTYVLGKPFAGEDLARLLGRALRTETR